MVQSWIPKKVNLLRKRVHHVHLLSVTSFLQNPNLLETADTRHIASNLYFFPQWSIPSDKPCLWKALEPSWVPGNCRGQLICHGASGEILKPPSRWWLVNGTTECPHSRTSKPHLGIDKSWGLGLKGPHWDWAEHSEKCTPPAIAPHHSCGTVQLTW